MLREHFAAMREQKRQGILERLEAQRLRFAEPDDLPLAAMPTSHWAGSREKIEVMRERAERGEAVFHPEDCELILVR